jgi:hypothetical protein
MADFRFCDINRQFLISRGLSELDIVAVEKMETCAAQSRKLPPSRKTLIKRAAKRWVKEQCHTPMIKGSL